MVPDLHQDNVSLCWSGQAGTGGRSGWLEGGAVVVLGAGKVGEEQAGTRRKVES